MLSLIENFTPIMLIALVSENLIKNKKNCSEYFITSCNLRQ